VNKANQAITFNSLANRTFNDLPFPRVGERDALGPHGGVLFAHDRRVHGHRDDGDDRARRHLHDRGQPARQQQLQPRASGPQAFTVAKDNQSISFGALGNKTFNNAPFTVSASASPSGLAVVFSSLTTGVCTVSGTTVTLVAAGACQIAAEQPGDGDYNPAVQVIRGFNVAKDNQTISFTAPAGQPYTPTPIPLSATATSGLTVAFSSLTPLVCSVSGASLTLLATGTAPSPRTRRQRHYNAASQVTGDVVVSQASQTITFGTLAGKIFGDAPFTVSATGGASGNTVTFTSTTLGVCTVSGATVTIVAAGTCTIAANQAGNGNYNAAPQVSQSFAVAKASQSISFGAIADRDLSATPVQPSRPPAAAQATRSPSRPPRLAFAPPPAPTARRSTCWRWVPARSPPTRRATPTTTPRRR
jgi:hypothetical protein